MLKKLFKYIIYFLFFIVIFALFIPKSNLYFLLQKEIKQYKVELITSDIENKYFALNLKNTNIKYENINVGTISNINFATYIFKTDLEIKNIKLDSMISKFIPAKINSVNLNYSVLAPDKINIKTVFKGGSCTGYIDTLQKVVKLNIKLSKKLKSKYRLTVMMLKKDKIEGDYTYEYKF